MLGGAANAPPLWQLPARVAWSASCEGVCYAGCEFLLDGLSAEQIADLLRGPA
jgi:hypothetical protein